MKIPSGRPVLGDDEVQIWCASLGLDTASVAATAQILSQEELQKAARFVRPLDCERFIRAHGILRSLLGFYLAVEPASIVFTRGRYGKPALRPSDINASLHFNLSYSHGLALCAISRSFEVGIDVELIQPRLESLHLAEQYLPAGEVSRLRDLLPPQRTDAFFQAWTRMEARQKLSGKGLHSSLGESAEATETACSEEGLSVQDGYAAALAVGGHGYTVQYLDWPASRSEHVHFAV